MQRLEDLFVIYSCGLCVVTTSIPGAPLSPIQRLLFFHFKSLLCFFFCQVFRKCLDGEDCGSLDGHLCKLVFFIFIDCVKGIARTFQVSGSVLNPCDCLYVPSLMNKLAVVSLDV